MDVHNINVPKICTMNVKHIHTNKDKAPRVRLNYIGYPKISLINHSWLITQSLIRSREREKVRE